MTSKKHFRVYVPRIIAAVVIAVAVFFIVKLILGFIHEKPNKNEKKIQSINLVAPPPPPPPPPKMEKLPEPEIKEKIQEPEPDPEPLPDTPDEAPARDLGLDAEGTAGSDGFGLAARKGGTGLFGGNGDPYAFYSKRIKDEVFTALSKHDELRRKSYSATVKIKIKSDGSVDGIELIKGSNDSELDETISRILDQLKIHGEPPPPGMPQTIKIRISNRI